MEVATDIGADKIQDNIASRLRGRRQDDTGHISEAVAPDTANSHKMTTNTGSSVKFRTFVMAGAAAGIMEHCVMYPVDSVKVGHAFGEFWAGNFACFRRQSFAIHQYAEWLLR